MTTATSARIRSGHLRALGLLGLLAFVTPAADAAQIVVLKSENLSSYDPAIRGFTESIGSKDVVVWDMEGDRAKADEMVARLRQTPPLLVYALGAKAAFVAANELDGVPVIYGMVRDPERYGIDGAEVTGVVEDIPPETVLSQFLLFVPEVRRIGVILGTGNPAAEGMVRAAQDLGLDLRIMRVENWRDVRAVYTRMSRQVDALWLLPDPEVVTPDNFHFLRQQSRQIDIPILAYSEAMVRAGALLCVVPDHQEAGTRAAALALRILDEGVSPADLPPDLPEGMRVVLNHDALETLGLEIDPLMLDFTDEVVGETLGR